MGEPFYILALDGGGSKGAFSLGVLEELEKAVSKPLHQQFQLIYGTSVGAIEASLLAAGKSVAEISNIFFEVIPEIMGKWTAAGRSAALRKVAKKQFENMRFEDFQTMIGIVAMNYETRRPMIFKNTVTQAHGLASSFKPGFGCSVAEAITASCAAMPYFQKVRVQTKNQGSPILIDGGFVANNPTLFAIADALGPLKIKIENVRVVSVGVGGYRERPGVAARVLERLLPVEAVLAANTNTLEIIRKLLFKGIRVVRIDDAFADKQYETSLLETRKDVLLKLKGLGRLTYGKYEAEVRDLMTT